MTEELLEIVDQNDNIVGIAPRSEAIKNGLLHRAVMIVVINSNGKIFLQQRSKNKKVYPLAWDISSAEHNKIGETYKEAAQRGIKEELGIENTNLKKIKRGSIKIEFGNLKDYELFEIFEAKYSSKITLDKSEVNQGKFLSIDKIKKMIDGQKEQFTPWFLQEWPAIEAHLTK